MGSTTPTLHDVLTGLVWTEKSAAAIEDGTYTFRVAPTAHKTRVRQAVEEIWGVRVTAILAGHPLPSNVTRLRA